MIVRALRVLGVGGFLILGCGSESELRPASETKPITANEPETVSVAGTYEVSGYTVEKQGSQQREIEGTVILAQEGDRYTATFHLTTLFPGPDGPLNSNVIGKGEGQIEGRILGGTASTQIVAASVPGVDSGFALIPRQVGTRIVSTTTARVTEDGSINVEIESEPVPGQAYAETRTSLRGARIAPAIDVAAPPPE